jgi:hypothetical protein
MPTRVALWATAGVVPWSRIYVGVHLPFAEVSQYLGPGLGRFAIPVGTGEELFAAMTAPVVAVGDGALGFWAALGDVFPTTVEQRCWVHKTANILDALPKRLHRQAKAAIHEVYRPRPAPTPTLVSTTSRPCSQRSIPKRSTSWSRTATCC